MRSRIIVSKNGQTLVARGSEYVSPQRSALMVETSRQFENDRVNHKPTSTMGSMLERAAIYGRPEKVSKLAAKRQANLEKARALPTLSTAEAISLLESVKRADDLKAKAEARRKEREEAVRAERREEALEARREASRQRLTLLAGLNKAG